MNDEDAVGRVHAWVSAELESGAPVFVSDVAVCWGSESAQAWVSSYLAESTVGFVVSRTGRGPHRSECARRFLDEGGRRIDDSVLAVLDVLIFDLRWCSGGGVPAPAWVGEHRGRYLHAAARAERLARAA